MNKFLISLCLLCVTAFSAMTAEDDLRDLKNSVGQLNNKIEQLSSSNQQLQSEIFDLKSQNQSLSDKLRLLEAKSDSIDNVLLSGVSSNTELANSNHAAATQKIEVVESNTESNLHQLTVWGIWAIVVLLIVAVAVYLILHRGISSSKDAISAIRNAQANLEEESVKLDTKLVEVLDKQMQFEKAQTKSSASSSASTSIDHTLALKVADEITRIEMNLSRMDSSVKGYKQLAKAVERIKNNFQANGYEIVTYVGQAYNEGMRINADFVIDEELPAGTRTITSVSKPQVHHNGNLIQKATVTVTQNI